MRSPTCLAVSALIALIFVSGCASGPADGPAPQKPAGLAPEGSPKERLDEERMAAATKGLRFEAGFVRTSTAGARDSRKGEALRLQAERVTQEKNSWFVSVGAFRDAILADPKNAKCYEGLARAFLLEGDTDQAMAALATAVDLDPKFAEARYQFGMVKQMNSDYAGAVGEWRALTQINPNYRDTFARMAIASYYDRDFPSSWRYLAEADKRHQDVPGQFRGLLREADKQP